ncbi:hypothetical protein [Flavobacterium sp. SM2513]|uniref:hypothetical protein n=1 Tax=Flavobacterium sp. SM2513 TaxID=3424766 RepID=UPI003D7FD354
MSLDQLILNIKKISSEKDAIGLANYIQEWKTNEMTAVELRSSVEKYLGNIWLENNFDYLHMYSVWSEFRDVAIDGIGGMTMNERLYHFGLLEAYEKLITEKEKEKFFTKLMATK